MAATTWSTTDLVNVTLSGANLIATASGTLAGVRGKDPKRSGKFYIEYGPLPTSQGAGNTFGFASRRTPLGQSTNPPATTGVLYTVGTLVVYDTFGTAVSPGINFGSLSGVVLCCAIDLDARLVWFRLGAAGNWNNAAANNPATGVGGVNIAPAGLGQGIDVYPFTYLSTTGNSVTLNAGGSAFTGSVPSGYTSGWDDSVAAVSYAVGTQLAVEEWARAPVVYAQLTQVLVEEWASVTLGPYPVATDQARVMVLA